MASIFRRIWLGLLAAVALLTLQSAGICLYWGLCQFSASDPSEVRRSVSESNAVAAVTSDVSPYLFMVSLITGAGKKSRQPSCTWPTGRPDYGGRNKRHIADFEFRIDRVIIIVPECIECNIFSVKPVLTEINRDSVLETE